MPDPVVDLMAALEESVAKAKAARQRRPQRIQLRRTKGWRKPEGAIVVSRPGKWGNPFRVKAAEPAGYRLIVTDPKSKRTTAGPTQYPTELDAIEAAVGYFRTYITHCTSVPDPDWYELDLTELAGHDLACWCPLDQPCHADVLLELANGAER